MGQKEMGAGRHKAGTQKRTSSEGTDGDTGRKFGEGAPGGAEGWIGQGGCVSSSAGSPPFPVSSPPSQSPPLLHRVSPTRSPPPKPLLVLAGRIPASSDPVTNEAAARPGGAAGAPPSAFRLCPGKFSPPSPPQSWAPGGPGLQGCGQPLAGAACPPSAHNAARCCLINVQIA